MADKCWESGNLAVPTASPAPGMCCRHSALGRPGGAADEASSGSPTHSPLPRLPLGRVASSCFDVYVLKRISVRNRLHPRVHKRTDSDEAWHSVDNECRAESGA